MSTNRSFDRFVIVLLRSGLMSELDVERLTREATQGESFPIDDSEKLSLFEREVIGRGILTKWQVEMLIRGKFRGFFVHPYELREWLGDLGDKSGYLARNKEQPGFEAILELDRTKRASNRFDPANFTVKYIRPVQNGGDAELFSKTENDG